MFNLIFEGGTDDFEMLNVLIFWLLFGVPSFEEYEVDFDDFSEVLHVSEDNITLNLIAEYHHLSSFSVSLLNQKFVSAIVSGEFCEVLLKYVLSKYLSVSETPRTHNLKELFLC